MPSGKKLFKPGQSGNPAGRPKGARSKFSEKFVTDFIDDWEVHGATAIAEVRETKPEAYLAIAAKLLPRLIDVSGTITAQSASLSKLDEFLASAAGEREARTIEGVATERSVLPIGVRPKKKGRG